MKLIRGIYSACVWMDKKNKENNEQLSKWFFLNAQNILASVQTWNMGLSMMVTCSFWV